MCSLKLGNKNLDINSKINKIDFYENENISMEKIKNKNYKGRQYEDNSIRALIIKLLDNPIKYFGLEAFEIYGEKVPIKKIIKMEKVFKTIKKQKQQIFNEDGTPLLVEKVYYRYLYIRTGFDFHLTPDEIISKLVYDNEDDDLTNKTITDENIYNDDKNIRDAINIELSKAVKRGDLLKKKVRIYSKNGEEVGTKGRGITEYRYYNPNYFYNKYNEQQKIAYNNLMSYMDAVSVRHKLNYEDNKKVREQQKKVEEEQKKVREQQRKVEEEQKKVKIEEDKKKLELLKEETIYINGDFGYIPKNEIILENDTYLIKREFIKKYKNRKFLTMYAYKKLYGDTKLYNDYLKYEK